MSDGQPMAQTILVIGAGQAGGRAAEALRATGFTGRIVLAGDERVRPYERPPLSKDVLLADNDADCFAGWLQPESFYVDARIERRDEGVERLDVANRIAGFRNGPPLRFDQCLLATGGRARDLPGLPSGAHVYSLRTLADAMRLRERLTRSKSVAVIGGGFLGLEFAASARSRGLDVTIYETAPRLLGRAVPAAFADRLRAKHESHGVRFIFNADALRVDPRKHDVRMVTDGGTADFDFCVVAIGQTPNDDLARASGIATGNGILVDEYCRTSVPGIYAAGDCANFPFGATGQRLRLESWQNAQEQAIVAARNMAGEHTAYRPTPWFWTDQYDWNIQMLGMPDHSIEHWIERPSPDGKALSIGLRDGVIAYALAVNQGGELRALRRLVERGTSVDPAALADPAVKLRQLDHRAV
ncbi:NAD(P)/FAD-dependent oxidoreductase [Burkholderia sp. JKS000303]|uniref:NAD(P)/FAD-dependent oxidoreductase n=1 Tax=Burkholderia sp. JKS000303 TaxID=1938747 RepID=UPI000C00A237|nr:FAD-dependent oxidoreductase [Burkholderia sp. JKS000303]PFH29868.1 3-phenylpropionate/trans-cinnamate dioxygenase ferredoxin reductase subunit [Burkholderia sp. JKS000303]